MRMSSVPSFICSVDMALIRVAKFGPLGPFVTCWLSFQTSADLIITGELGFLLLMNISLTLMFSEPCHCAEQSTHRLSQNGHHNQSNHPRCCSNRIVCVSVCSRRPL